MCCGIFRCFGWILDILQRLLTFMLCSVLCFAICVGCVVAVGAGVAYGYNFSVAEYLDLKKSDVMVYVRRGQFGDHPPLKPPLRRSGDDFADLYSSTDTSEYQDHNFIDNAKPLSDAWQKAQDTSNYADKLVKYSKMRSHNPRRFPKDEEEFETLEPQDSIDLFDKKHPPERTSTSKDTSIRTVRLDDLLNQSPDKNIDQRRPEGRRKNKKHKHRQKKPKVNIELDEDKSLYLQPNATKFLYRQEDFEDGDTELNGKPV